jgi:hypothetical protein
MQALSLPIEIVNCILSFNDKEFYWNKYTKQRHIRIKQKYMEDTFSYLFKNMKKARLFTNDLFITNFHNSILKVYQFVARTLSDYEGMSNFHHEKVDMAIMALNPEEFYIEECYSTLRIDSATYYAKTATRKWIKKKNVCLD